MEDRLVPPHAGPQPGTFPQRPGDPICGRVWGGHSPVQLKSLTHTRARARAHTHTHGNTHTHTYTHTSTHTRAHPRTQARVRAAGSKLCALVRSLPPPPLGSSKGNRGRRGGNLEVLGSSEAWAGPAFSPPQVLGRPGGPWIKTIRTEQSGLDATFPPPRLG